MIKKKKIFILKKKINNNIILKMGCKCSSEKQK